MMNTWWSDAPAERFWLEVTDREDIGSDLRAPLHDDAGQENWRYSLFQHARIGDIVLHYKKPAIVGFSRISGPSVSAEIVWAARGSYAREKGTRPHERPGYRIPLSDLTLLNPPVTLQDLRNQRPALEQAVAEVQRQHKGPHYFPFELSVNRDLRLLQGYAFKMPASILALFPSMEPIAELAGQTKSVERVAVHEPPGRNPPWGRDELLLALDLYLANDGNPPGKSSRPVIELSDLLGAMGKALGQGDAATYRNPNGVYMKLMNFRRFDPAFTSDGRVGLARGNKDEEVVWNEFAGDRARLAAVAAAIRDAVTAHGEDQLLLGEPEPDFREAEEGRVLTRLHRVRERNRKLVVACKERAMKRHGRLACAACAFDFKAAYGPTVEGLIEVHHTKPVHTLSEGSKTNIDDLALLCANCHRVVHSSRRWLTVAEVQALLASRATPDLNTG
jgi:predicted HNH restriction endonuclease